MTPALRNARMSFRMRLSATRLAISPIRTSWLTRSNYLSRPDSPTAAGAGAIPLRALPHRLRRPPPRPEADPHRGDLPPPLRLNPLHPPLLEEAIAPRRNAGGAGPPCPLRFPAPPHRL